MASRVTPPPLLQVPTAKEKKYDRQLRLWAASGQAALENAHVLLLNNGPGVVGIETLKNLVLPGVGNITIVDERVVCEEDLGVNFFLIEESLGKSRAKASLQYLLELNPDVNGYAVQESVADFIRKPSPFNQYTLILLIAPISSLRTLDYICRTAYENSIPLFYVHSNGFYSQFSIQLPALFPIVDTHPDSTATEDLRLLNPWRELTELMRVKTEGLDTMDGHEHGHIPYLLLLLHFLEKWKESHAGHYPSTYVEKSAFRELVREGARKKNPEGGEENFDEAVAAVLKSLNQPSISRGLREVFEADECKSETSLPDSSNFWVIAKAIQMFHTKYNALPLPGALPDMKTRSADYAELQNVYKTKARKDSAEVVELVRSLESSLKRSSAAIPAKEVEAFCKGAAFVKLIRGTRLRIAQDFGHKDHHEATDWQNRAAYILQEVETEDSLIPIWLSLLALDDYVDKKGLLVPSGSCDNSSDDTHSRKFRWSMAQYTENLLGRLADQTECHPRTDAAQQRIDRTLMELTRAGPAELHNISALTGGMVAQEVIKAITKQYVPIDNTCIFDGISSRSATFKL